MVHPYYYNTLKKIESVIDEKEFFTSSLHCGQCCIFLRTCYETSSRFHSFRRHLTNNTLSRSCMKKIIFLPQKTSFFSVVIESSTTCWEKFVDLIKLSWWKETKWIKKGFLNNMNNFFQLIFAYFKYFKCFLWKFHFQFWIIYYYSSVIKILTTFHQAKWSRFFDFAHSFYLISKAQYKTQFRSILFGDI